MVLGLIRTPASDKVMSAALFGLSIITVTLLSRVRQFSAKRERLLASPFKNPIPKQPHMTLVEPELKPKAIIIGDIHGCLDEFKMLLAACDYDPLQSSVILVGDLVNKGPYSAEVVRYAREIGAYAVRGNHDDFALQYALKDQEVIPPKLDYVKKLSK
jgi:hypothetical protein